MFIQVKKKKKKKEIVIPFDFTAKWFKNIFEIRNRCFGILQTASNTRATE